MKNPQVLAREKALLDEVSILSAQQSAALQKAIFLPFTREEAAEYDARAEQIGEIGKLLAAPVVE